MVGTFNFLYGNARVNVSIVKVFLYFAVTVTDVFSIPVKLI